MTVSVGSDSLRLESRPGVTAASGAAERTGFLSDVIVEMGFASRELVDDAVEQSRAVGKLAGAILVEEGEITEEQLARATAERNMLPYVDLEAFEIEPGAQQLIAADAARRYRAMPVAFDADGALVVVLADPLDAIATSDIAVMTKCEVRAAVATDSAIESLIDQMPKRPSLGLQARLRPEAPVSRRPRSIRNRELEKPERDLEPELTLPPLLARAKTTVGPVAAPERSFAAAEPEQNGASPSRQASDVLQDRIAATVDAAHSEVATAFENATAEIEALADRVETLEQECRELRAERDALRQQLDRRPKLLPP